MDIQIISNDTQEKFRPIRGERTQNLLDRLAKEIDSEGVDTIEREAIEVLSHCSNPTVDKVQSSTSLVVGYVQSGKTMSFTTLSALASDNGYRIIIYFAGIKDNLVEQTSERLREDLLDDGNNNQVYKLHENPTVDEAQRIKSELLLSSKPTILITIHKNPNRIKKLIELLSTTTVNHEIGKKGVMIIDDEADQASLNGYAYKNSKNHSENWEDDAEFTSTYQAILKLRSILPNHSYVQYTATPQGPLLISLLDLLSPKYHTVLTPGKGYTGGKTFFKDEPGLVLTIPETEVYNYRRNNLTECPPSLIEALQLHMMGVAIVVRLKKTAKFLSMMVHADREQDASQTFHTWIASTIDMWTNFIRAGKDDIAYINLMNDFKNRYSEAIREYSKHDEDYPSFEQIADVLPDIICDTNLELIISNKRKKNIKIAWKDYPSHILVGAEMLNRGFTVKNLAVTYMPRYSVGKSTADTIQQRCRFFGYKQKYLWSCRVFLPDEVQVEYSEYVEHEEEMRKWLKESKNIDEVERLLIISPRMNATRKNILSVDTVNDKLRGWRLTNAVQAIDENNELVHNFLGGLTFEVCQNYGTPDRNHRFAKLPIQDVIDFLTGFKFQNMPDSARKQATLRYLKYYASHETSPITHAYIVQMAYDGEPRLRQFNDKTLKIGNLHTGRSIKGKTTYPGDKEIKFDDSITIQIHHIKLKSTSNSWGGKELYTLAIYYPDEMAINFVNSQNRK